MAKFAKMLQIVLALCASLMFNSAQADVEMDVGGQPSASVSAGLIGGGGISTTSSPVGGLSFDRGVGGAVRLTIDPKMAFGNGHLRFSAGFDAATAKVKLVGREIGETDVGGVSGLVLYSFQPKASVRPYVGLGLKSMWLGDSSANGLRFEGGSNVGLAVAGGVEGDLPKGYFFDSFGIGGEWSSAKVDYSVKTIGGAPVLKGSAEEGARILLFVGKRF